MLHLVEERKHLLETRSGTAATRPRVRMVGRVSNLEDCGCSCSGSGCGGTVETRDFPETPKLAEIEGVLLEIGNLVAEGVYLMRRCW